MPIEFGVCILHLYIAEISRHSFQLENLLIVLWKKCLSSNFVTMFICIYDVDLSKPFTYITFKLICQYVLQVTANLDMLSNI